MKRENDYQAGLIRRIKNLMPEAVVLKNDAGYIQGIPDLTILFGPRWAMLETKRSASAPHRPNQDYYISKLGQMGFARFICPENEEEVLRDLQQTFRD